MEDFFQVGIITATHGLKGEVKVFPTTDDVKRFKRLREVILDTGKERIGLEVESVKFFKQFAIVKFKGIDDISAVEKYRKASILVTRENAVRLKKDEYFIADLMGLKVRDESDSEIGVLRDVMETGANDVYCVSSPSGKEILLPAIKDCILKVDLEKNEMLVHVLDGLLDL